MEIISQIPRLPPRRPDSHKGNYGRILIIAGSVGMTGAAALAGRAALRAGAGLVRIATARSALSIVASIDPCYTTIALAEDSLGRIAAAAIDTILDAVSDSDVVVFGPGIGQSADLRAITSRLIAIKGLRLLIDADGLNNLVRLKGWQAQLASVPILTPHPGEMKRLWATLTDQPPQPDRCEWARAFVQKVPVVLVLKGAGTVVTDGARLYVNTTGNPGMATAGAGDVLSGVIAALMGQGLTDLDAAILGTYLHGLAGDIAAAHLGQVSLTATDLIDALPKAFASLAGRS
ncbi:MAG: NAD(P)H-hydrate dehydratase [Sedimentisphaerales bacterium]|jgi:NAD(P)H-hydrate epimerase|nr:NAD(P)H-hydrate dehydratase [Sedimentisphaerales bacterium]